MSLDSGKGRVCIVNIHPELLAALRFLDHIDPFVQKCEVLRRVVAEKGIVVKLHFKYRVAVCVRGLVGWNLANGRAATAMEINQQVPRLSMLVISFNQRISGYTYPRNVQCRVEVVIHKGRDGIRIQFRWHQTLAEL